MGKLIERFKRAWRGEIHLDSPPRKLFLLGMKFAIVPQKKVPDNTLIIACHPRRQHEVLKAFNEAVAEFDPRVKKVAQ